MTRSSGAIRGPGHRRPSGASPSPAPNKPRPPPAPAPAGAAAATGAPAYVGGGYPGTRWLDTIVAWGPQGAPRVVAPLPFGLRYAAVADAAGRLVIAGGSLADGRASSAILEY